MYGQLEGNDTVKFTLRDTSGHDQTVTYVWRDDNTLEIYLAGDAKGLVCGGCFNLDGVPGGNMLDHTLWINAARYVTPGSTPAQVKGTAMDFTTAQPLIRLVEAHVRNPKGRWLINDWEEDVMQEVAVLASHNSGRQLNLYTTAPQLRASLFPDAYQAPKGLILSCPAPRLAFLEFKTLR